MWNKKIAMLLSVTYTGFEIKPVSYRELKYIDMAWSPFAAQVINSKSHHVEGNMPCSGAVDMVCYNITLPVYKSALV